MVGGSSYGFAMPGLGGGVAADRPMRARSGVSGEWHVEACRKPEGTLECSHVALELAGDQRYDRAGVAGPTGPARPVDVGVPVVGGIEVDNARDIVDVDAASDHVGGDQRVGLAG